MTSYVYFIGNDVHVKIGHTNNPEKRLNQIKTGNPEQIEILAQLRSKEAEKIELQLHALFKGNRLEGEWFSHTPSISQMIQYFRNLSNFVISWQDVEFAQTQLYKPMSNTDEQYARDTMTHSVASTMCQGDLSTIGKVVNGYEMGCAIAYYAHWLSERRTVKYKVFKSPAKKHWQLIDAFGVINDCPNYFKTSEFSKLRRRRKSDLAISITDTSQLQMFKQAS